MQFLEYDKREERTPSQDQQDGQGSPASPCTSLTEQAGQSLGDQEKNVSTLLSAEQSARRQRQQQYHPYGLSPYQSHVLQVCNPKGSNRGRLRANTAEWYQLRATPRTFTASSIGALLGFSKYKTRRTAIIELITKWLAKTPDNTYLSPAIAYGVLLEDVAVEHYREKYWPDLEDAHKDCHWYSDAVLARVFSDDDLVVLASPDLYIPCGPHIVEVKVPLTRKIEEGLENIPVDWLCQTYIQGYIGGVWSATLFIYDNEDKSRCRIATATLRNNRDHYQVFKKILGELGRITDFYEVVKNTVYADPNPEKYRRNIIDRCQQMNNYVFLHDHPVAPSDIINCFK